MIEIFCKDIKTNDSKKGLTIIHVKIICIEKPHPIFYM